MRALTYCSRITLILAILVTSPLLAMTEIGRDCREDPTQEQIEEGIKLFDYAALYTDEFELAPKAIKRVEDCIRNCNRKQRSLVIKEILLHRQFRGLCEDCTSSDEKYKYIMYDANYNSGDSTAYQVWQSELLDTGLTFCDPLNNLYCSPISKKCECRPGTTLNGDECITIVGGFCWIPGVMRPPFGYFPRIFEAYHLQGYGVIRGTGCIPYSGLQQRFCSTDLKLFMHNICSNTEFAELDRSLDFRFGNPKLHVNFGDSCNLDHQTQLFTTTEEEIKDYTIRVKKLEAILAAKPSFCDHSQLLICGSEGKCECMKPAIYNPETKLCTFRSPHEGCEAEGKFNKTAGPLPGRVRQGMMKGFRSILNRECPVGCYDVKLPDDTLVEPNSKFCATCGNIAFDRVVRLGENCDKIVNGFLDGTPPPSLPIDIPNYDKQLELFVKFNERAQEFERLFHLGTNSSCDYEAELDTRRIIHRIKNVEVHGTILTAEDYNHLMRSMNKQISGTKRFCRVQLREFDTRKRPYPHLPKPPPIKKKPILLCSPVTPNATSVCHEPSDAVYLEELMKRLSEKSFQVKPTSPSCSPHPRDVIQYAEEQFPISRPSNANPNFVTTGLSTVAYEYLFIRLENLWIQSVQFCNRTGGFKCTKSVDDKTNVTGRCEFSQDVLDEVQAQAEAELEKMEAERKKMEAERKKMEADGLAGLNITSKSSHRSLQHLFPTLLFTLHIINLN